MPSLCTIVAVVSAAEDVIMALAVHLFRPRFTCSWLRDELPYVNLLDRVTTWLKAGNKKGDHTQWYQSKVIYFSELLQQIPYLVRCVSLKSISGVSSVWMSESVCDACWLV